MIFEVSRQVRSSCEGPALTMQQISGMRRPRHAPPQPHLERKHKGDIVARNPLHMNASKGSKEAMVCRIAMGSSSGLGTGGTDTPRHMPWKHPSPVLQPGTALPPA